MTDVAFIGSSYVKEKPQTRSESQPDKARMMTKVYRVHSSFDLRSLVIRDNLRGGEGGRGGSPVRQTRLTTWADWETEFNPLASFLAARLQQLLHFFSFSWQERIQHPGYDLGRDVEKILAAAKVMETIMEVEEIPDLEEVSPPEVDINAGDIKSKMTGALADWALVKKKNPPEKPKQNLKVESKISTASSTGDWRSEIKKRERAKQQEKLNAMPLGMPDYREPEKLQVVDWREKLKKEAADDNPMNKWKKFDSGVKKTTRPPPQKPKPKPSKVPKEDPCTCNVGNCKVHSKFAFSLKSAAKKPSEVSKPEEPLKRRSSVKKKPEGSKPSKAESEAKAAKLTSDHGSRASSVVADTNPDTTEVIKIINFVAIKMTTKNTSKKTRSTEELEKLPATTSSPPAVSKEASPLQQQPMSSSSQSPMSSSPPPVKLPSPPPPPPPPPLLDETQSSSLEPEVAAGPAERAERLPSPPPRPPSPGKNIST